MQIEMRDLARKAAEQRSALPPRYFALFRRWFAVRHSRLRRGMVILWLMIAKPF